MNQVNRLIISRRDFKNEDELYAKVAQTTRVLLESDYLVLLHDADEKGGTIVIDFMPAEGDIRAFWLNKAEMLSALNTHVDMEVAKAKEVLNASNSADKTLTNEPVISKPRLIPPIPAHKSIVLYIIILPR